MVVKIIVAVMLFNTDAASVASNGALTDMANMTGGFSFDLTAPAGNNTATYTYPSVQLNLCGLTFTEPPVLGTSPVKTYFNKSVDKYINLTNRLLRRFYRGFSNDLENVRNSLLCVIILSNNPCQKQR